MCKKCTRRHHTLLHREADNFTQKKPENEDGKEEAHVAALSVSEWFQVSGVEDDANKIKVEAYMLKKITKDLPLHPIPLALKWDLISDLELADTVDPH